MRLFLILSLLALIAMACRTKQYTQVSPTRYSEEVGIELVRDSTEGFRLFYTPGSWAESNIEMLKADARAAKAKTLELLGIELFYQPIDYYFLQSRAKLEKLVKSSRGFGGTDPDKYLAAALVGEGREKPGAYLVFHVIAENHLGRTLPWLMEGMAVLADDQWYGYDLHALANYMAEKDLLVPIDDLIARPKRQEPGYFSPQSGSFVKFLAEKYGKEKLIELWIKGSREFTKVFGILPDVAGRQWLDHVSSFSTEGISYLEDLEARD